VQFSGIEDRIAVDPGLFSGYLPEGNGGQCDHELKVSSLRESVGVPPSSRIQLVLVTDPDGRENDGYFGSDLFSGSLTV